MIRTEAEELDQRIGELKAVNGNLKRAASAVMSYDFFGAEIASVEQTSFGHRIVLEVNASPNEAMWLLPGRPVTLSAAVPELFLDLEAEV